MKLKQILVIVLSMALVACISVAATVAYLTDETAPVVNTFTVGKVAITLYETDVDEYGEPSDDPSAEPVPVKKNEYKLLPNKQYMKDPYITVEDGSEDCWLFVKLENGIAGIEATGDGEKTIADQMKDNGWTEIDATDHIWAYEVAKSQKAVVKTFESFKIKADATADELARYKDAKITVTAYAIQKEGFTDAENAWKTNKGNFESVEKDTTGA